MVPPWAPRPPVGGTYRLDLVEHPERVTSLQPGTRYEVHLPGGIEADYYTDPTGQARYFETVTGTTTVPNPVLDTPQPAATYVVHPTDGRYTVILRTDTQGRLAEVATDPLARVGAYGHGGHPFATVLGAWPGRVSPYALLASASASAADGLAALAARLTAAVNNGQHVAVRIQASYLDARAVPSRFRVDYAIDGQTTTEVFPNM